MKPVPHSPSPPPLRRPERISDVEGAIGTLIDFLILLARSPMIGKALDAVAKQEASARKESSKAKSKNTGRKPSPRKARTPRKRAAKPRVPSPPTPGESHP